MGLGAGSQCGRLLVPDMDPAHVIPLANGIGDAVERIAREAVHSFRSRECECLYQNLCDGGHSSPFRTLKRLDDSGVEVTIGTVDWSLELNRGRIDLFQRQSYLQDLMLTQIYGCI